MEVPQNSNININTGNKTGLIKSILRIVLPLLLGASIVALIAPKIDILSNKEVKNLKKENKQLEEYNKQLSINIENRNKIIEARNLVIEEKKKTIFEKDSIIAISDTNIIKLEKELKSIEKIITVLNEEYKQIDNEHAKKINSIDEFTTNDQFRYLSNLLRNKNTK